MNFGAEYETAVGQECVGTSILRNKSNDTSKDMSTTMSPGRDVASPTVGLSQANRRSRDPTRVLHAPPRATTSAAERPVTIAHLFSRTVLTRDL